MRVEFTGDGVPSLQFDLICFMVVMDSEFKFSFGENEETMDKEGPGSWIGPGVEFGGGARWIRDEVFETVGQATVIPGQRTDLKVSGIEEIESMYNGSGKKLIVEGGETNSAKFHGKMKEAGGSLFGDTHPLFDKFADGLVSLG